MHSLIKRIIAETKTYSIYINFENITSNKLLKHIITLFLLPFGVVKDIFDRYNGNYHKKYDLSVVLICKNEGKYLKEWLNYYKLLGFQKFYIFNNDSTDNTFSVLKKYIKNGLVDYTVLHGKSRQLDAYNIALKKSREEAKYLAIVDADEFIYIPNDKLNLLTVINRIFKSNKHIGGIGVNWLIFGSSHYIKQPKGYVTQKYLYRSRFAFRFNRHIKTICDPRKVIAITNPHFAVYKKGYYAVDTSGKPIKGAMTSEYIGEPLRINHYFTKSREEFFKKRQRGMADQNGFRPMSDFKVHDRNEIFDDGMLRYKDFFKNCK